LQRIIKNHRYTPERATLALVIPTLLLACKTPDADPVAVAPVAAVAATCGNHGFLRTTLVGGIDARIDWSAEELICESMLRPQDEGARLRFTGEIDGRKLAVIVALPDLQRGQSGKELPSNVTITVEGSGRFFSTPNLASCWTDIDEQPILHGNPGRYAITGALFCIAPLGELNGDATISITEFSFRSFVQWPHDTPSTSEY
jgi:hypothetical protein